MEKDYTLKVWNTLTECYEEVMVTKELYDEYNRYKVKNSNRHLHSYLKKRWNCLRCLFMTMCLKMITKGKLD